MRNGKGHDGRIRVNPCQRSPRTTGNSLEQWMPRDAPPPSRPSTADHDEAGARAFSCQHGTRCRMPPGAPPSAADYWEVLLPLPGSAGALPLIFSCQASYSGVPARGGASLGNPPIECGSQSPTTPPPQPERTEVSAKMAAAVAATRMRGNVLDASGRRRADVRWLTGQPQWRDTKPS